MQQTREPPPAVERSRRRPPRRRSEESISLPRATPHRTKKVKLSQVLKAYQRAVVDVVEKRMAEVAEAAAGAARRAVAEAMESRTAAPDNDGATKVLEDAEERFQALSVRLQRIEDAIDRLAADHRALVEELGRRTGRGVVAVAKVVRKDVHALGEALAGLREDMAGVHDSVRSMDRTRWDGLRAARSRLDAPPT